MALLHRCSPAPAYTVPLIGRLREVYGVYSSSFSTPPHLPILPVVPHFLALVLIPFSNASTTNANIA